MTDLDILASRLQGLQRCMKLVGHLHPRLGAGVVVALAPMGDTRIMTRGARRHRSWHYARRAQRTPRRPAHPDGAVDGVCEHLVWFFETRKRLGRAHHGRMCHPTSGERCIRPRLRRFTRRYGMWPPHWLFHLNGRA
jgi:hypothetical protein